MPDRAEPLGIVSTSTGWIVSGEVDAHSAPMLAEALATMPVAQSTLDLGGVSFMDSSGLRVLVEATKRARASGGDLVVVNVTNAVSRLVAIGGLSDHLTVR
ncbi:MAG: STAS domain-containing protein [Acidimicrobiia bacterium]